jgi:isoquinoline 1-oxidoreductase alpha subunit
MRCVHRAYRRQATRSCVKPVESVAVASITTIEAIEQGDVGQRVS